MTKTVLFTTTILIFLFGSVLLAAPRPDSPPRCSHALPDHDLVHQFRLLEGESRSTRLLPHLLNREPEEMTFYDVTRYELDLEVYTDDEFITGEVLMEFVGAVTQLDTLLFHAGTNITLYDITQDEDWTRGGRSR